MFGVRLFREDVYILDLDVLQYVMVDEFGNAYIDCGAVRVRWLTRRLIDLLKIKGSI